MRHERESEASDLAPHLHEVRKDPVFARHLARHRLGVDVLEVHLERLECVQVARQRPLDEVRQERGTVDPAEIAGALGSLAKGVDDLDAFVPKRHEPPLGDEAVDAGETPFTGVAEADDPHHRLLVEFEDVREGREVILRGLYEVDPQERRASEARERRSPVDLVDAVALEEQRGHRLSTPYARK
jgi:hypothetical protein